MTADSGVSRLFRCIPRPLPASLPLLNPAGTLLMWETPTDLRPCGLVYDNVYLWIRGKAPCMVKIYTPAPHVSRPL